MLSSMAQMGEEFEVPFVRRSLTFIVKHHKAEKGRDRKLK